MAKITRVLQKIFAKDATNNGQFGSAQAGTKVITNDLATIQALAAFMNGWNDATLTGRQLPTVEEFQSLQYMNSTQIAYLFQEGVAEYNADTTYYTKSIVKKAGTYELYGSLVDDNIGNALTDGTKWEFLTDLSDESTPDATETVKGKAEIATNAETLAGSDDTRFITPLKLLYGFASSLAENGYIKFPSWMGGLIIQWGSAVAVGGGGTTISFPTSFPSVCYQVFVSSATGPANNATFNAYSKKISNFDLSNQNPSGTYVAQACSFFAVGK